MICQYIFEIIFKFSAFSFFILEFSDLSDCFKQLRDSFFLHLIVCWAFTFFLPFSTQTHFLHRAIRIQNLFLCPHSFSLLGDSGSRITSMPTPFSLLGDGYSRVASMPRRPMFSTHALYFYGYKELYFYTYVHNISFIWIKIFTFSHIRPTSTFPPQNKLTFTKVPFTQ